MTRPYPLFLRSSQGYRIAFLIGCALLVLSGLLAPVGRAQAPARANNRGTESRAARSEGRHEPASARGHVLRVAAASDLSFLMPVMAAAYEREKGVKLLVSTGSSSGLATQIVNGAPFDVFLGADFSFPEQVVAAGRTVEKAPVRYATGTLVLWARKDSPIKPLNVEQMTSPQVTRIAVADQFHAPYGRAALAALHAMKLDDKVKGKLVIGENVAQTAQFVETGNAQMGLISLSLAVSDKLKAEGEFVRLPMLYPDIEQCAVVMKGDRAAEGEAFLEWLRSPAVQQNLKQFGLDPAK